MTEVGQRAIDEAKANGSWSQIDSVDALVVPPDLQAALDAVPGASAAYIAMADSTKKQYLWWIHSAKRPTTRANRIDETVRRLMSGRTDFVRKANEQIRRLGAQPVPAVSSSNGATRASDIGKLETP